MCDTDPKCLFNGEKTYIFRISQLQDALFSPSGLIGIMSVSEFLQSLFDLVLVGLDIHNEPKYVTVRVNLWYSS